MRKLVVLLSALLMSGAAFADDKRPMREREINLSVFTEFSGGATKLVHEAEHNNSITVEGPLTWTNPVTRQAMDVFKRERYSGRSGATVTQYWAVQENGQGIGRVWDSRNPKKNRIGEIKFPLGRWREGEARSFVTNNNDRIVLSIENIDFEYRGVPHAVKFTWTYNGAECERYIYAPGKGMLYSYRC